jgi:hypothetical protein
MKYRFEGAITLISLSLHVVLSYTKIVIAKYPFSVPKLTPKVAFLACGVVVYHVMSVTQNRHAFPRKRATKLLPTYLPT